MPTLVVIDTGKTGLLNTRKYVVFQWMSDPTIILRAFQYQQLPSNPFTQGVTAGWTAGQGSAGLWDSRSPGTGPTGGSATSFSDTWAQGTSWSFALFRPATGEWSNVVTV